MAGPGLSVKKRLLAVLVIFSIITISLLFRTGYIQIVKGQSLQNMAYEQQNRGRIISPRRGTIFDTNGKALAVSASVETVTVNPKDIEKSGITPEEIAEDLATMLDLNKEDVYSKITAKSSYQTIKKRIERDVGDTIRKWINEKDISGVFLDEDTKRYYPGGNLAAHVIGFTGYDNQGLEGVEVSMEQYLKGVPGRILSETDGSGREVPFTVEKRIDAQDGLNVVLTIDETVQWLAQKALERAIADYKVQNGAVAIVMDPRNGDILALVSKPDFDLNSPWAAPPGVDPNNWKGKTNDEVKILQETVWRNKAVTDTYEPGSTFKAITSAAGLEENVVNPETQVNDFPVKIGKWTFNCWRNYKPHGSETFKEGVYNSCNPVFVRIAQSLGIERFYGYVRAFGFYDLTGIGLPGEVNGIFHAKPSEVDMAAASFGQRFTITPIQLVTAYTAVANGGNLMKPRLVKELTDKDGNVVKRFEPEVIRNVISQSTSSTLMQILEGVVANGTGRNAYVKGFRVAGKTGTSQTTEQGHYIASFVAVAPADNPSICAIVVLDNPKGDSYMGGVIAAPVAGHLVEETLAYLGVERKYSEEDTRMMLSTVEVPEVRKLKIDEATKVLKEKGLKYIVENSGNTGGDIIIEQMPKPGAKVHDKSVVILYTYKPAQELKVRVPDVLNKTVDEAVAAFSKCGLNIKITGMGTAVKQEVTPGTMVGKGSVIEVEFKYLDNVE